MSPNWCHNVLDITGPKDQIALFKEILTEFGRYPIDDEPVKMTFAISAFFPTPKNVGDGWYAWRCANWGTKWDVADSYLFKDEETVLGYDFDTAWGPPLAAIAVISTQYPKLHFEVNYTEQGMNFGGKFRVQDGKISLNEEHELNWEESEEVIK